MAAAADGHEGEPSAMALLDLKISAIPGSILPQGGGNNFVVRQMPTGKSLQHGFHLDFAQETFRHRPLKGLFRSVITSDDPAPTRHHHLSSSDRYRACQSCCLP